MCVAEAVEPSRGLARISRCSSLERTAGASRAGSRSPGSEPPPHPAATRGSISAVRRSILAAGLGALVLAPAGAASFDWPPSRVAAVRAVIYQVEVDFPIMRNPAYASGGRNGIEVTCRRRATARYRCSWRATNDYSIIDGRARVRFAHRRALVALRVTLCQRVKSSQSGAVIARCAVH